MKKVSEKNSCWSNFIVIIFIPSLFLLFMIAGFLGFIPLNVPSHSLGIIGFIFVIFLFFIRHNANYSVCMMHTSDTLLEGDLQKQLKKNSITIETQTKSILDVKHFLDNYYKDIRNDNFVSVASSVFPMLGILGTFIAIAISMPNFSVTDTASLDREISLLLSGVGSAFYASIYGILLSLLWTYFEKRGVSKVDSYVSEIEEHLEGELWTQEELQIYKYRQYDIKKSFDIELAQIVNNNNIEKIKEFMEEMNSSFTDISNKLNENSLNLVNALQEVDNSQTAVITRNEIKQTLEEFTTTTKSFKMQLNNITDNKLFDFTTKINKESEEAIKTVQRELDV